MDDSGAPTRFTAEEGSVSGFSTSGRPSWRLRLRVLLDRVLGWDPPWAVATTLALLALTWHRSLTGRLIPAPAGAPLGTGEPAIRSIDPTAVLGMTLVLSLIVAFLWRYAIDTKREHRRVRHLFPFLAILLVLHAAIGRAGMALSGLLARNLDAPFNRPESFWYLVPVAAGAVLVALLSNRRIAMVYSLFATAVISVVFDWSLTYALFVLLAHLAGVYTLGRYRTRAALLRSGLAVGLTGAAAAASLDAVTCGFQPWDTCLFDVLAAMTGGLIGVPLVVAFLLPILEWVFGVLTDIRLLELSNLDNPLLSELALRAPGSYNHSVAVGTLAEAAADSIGANPLFCRVAAYYHDIGKMKMPEYYIENQRPGENPHDRLAPSMSALILMNHVKEGIRLGREHGLPQPILDIIPQHHG